MPNLVRAAGVEPATFPKSAGRSTSELGAFTAGSTADQVALLSSEPGVLSGSCAPAWPGFIRLVGPAGFEPAYLAPPERRAAKLRHSPCGR